MTWHAAALTRKPKGIKKKGKLLHPTALTPDSRESHK